MRRAFCLLCLALSLPALGGELSFDFERLPLDEQPPGFTNLLYGKGRPGEWKIIMDDVPPLFAPVTTNAPVLIKQPVLAQLSRNPTDERFPLLIYEKEKFGDFTLTTKFKIVDGVIEQLAGIVFRVQDETNFYVIRANAMDNSLRFYKVVNGIRAPMIGPRIEVARNVWYELKINCEGNKIRAWLNGKEAIPPVTDNTFSEGRIGYWTKSDAVSYFADTKITYTPRERRAQVLVRTALDKYSRLKGLKISTLDENGEPHVVASKDEHDVGTAGIEAEKASITRGAIFIAKAKGTVTVIMPMRDRNGDPMAAVSVTMDSFPGQTQQNAIVRASPIVKEMQKQVRSLQQLTQ